MKVLRTGKHLRVKNVRYVMTLEHLKYITSVFTVLFNTVSMNYHCIEKNCKDFLQAHNTKLIVSELPLYSVTQWNLWDCDKR